MKKRTISTSFFHALNFQFPSRVSYYPAVSLPNVQKGIVPSSGLQEKGRFRPNEDRLLDDRPENLLALEAIIEREDYNLIKAPSGEEALKYLLKYDFATILLDVQMPGIDGFETAKIIKAREKSKNIPIIFITAKHMDSQHIFTGYFVGAIDYILKPFDPYTEFVDMYKMNQQLIQQTEGLVQKMLELEKAYQELSDITLALRRSEALANVISETSMDSMFILDQDGFILKVNPAVSKMFFFEEKEILGKSINLVLAIENPCKYIKNALKGKNRFANEVIAARKDGSAFPAEFQLGMTYVEDKCMIACTIRDITAKKQSEELITFMAYHDGLTDLPNRRRFNDQLNLWVSEAKQNNQSLAMM